MGPGMFDGVWKAFAIVGVVAAAVLVGIGYLIGRLSS